MAHVRFPDGIALNSRLSPQTFRQIFILVDTNITFQILQNSWNWLLVKFTLTNKTDLHMHM